MSAASAVHRRATGPVVLAATAILLAGCGSGSSGATNAASGAGNSTASSDLALPMASVTGTIASAGSAGVAVTTSSGKRDVAFGSATRFSKVSAATRSEAKVGDCVTAASKSGDVGATEVTATSVTISSGSACAARTITSGGPGAGSNGTPPSGAPQGVPPGGGYATPDGSGPSTSGGPPSGGIGHARFGGSIGTVTAVTGHAIKITTPSGSAATITTTAATTYSSRSTATKSDATSGRCIAAFGQRSGTTVDALSVTLSDPSGGKCPVITAAPVGIGGGPMLSGNGPSNG